VILGIILGLLNYFVKPILEVISLPLEIITLGLFTFVINIFLVSRARIVYFQINKMFEVYSRFYDHSMYDIFSPYFYQLGNK